MAKFSPFRDDNITDIKSLRLRLNQVIGTLNAPNPQHTVVVLPTVQNGQAIAIQSPGFPVGAIVLGGVRRTDGGALQTTSAPWLYWKPLGDGTLQVSIYGLNTTNPPTPAKYEVALVVMERNQAL